MHRQMECRVLDGLQRRQHRLFIPDSALLAVRLMVSQHIENFTAQVHGIRDPAFRGEKCAIHIEELVGTEKIVTKQGRIAGGFLFRTFPFFGTRKTPMSSTG